MKPSAIDVKIPAGELTLAGHLRLPPNSDGPHPFEYYGTERSSAAGWKNQMTRLSVEPALDHISEWMAAHLA